MELWTYIKIALQNKLAKVKSKLLSQLSDELNEPICNHKSSLVPKMLFLVSMVEMAYGLPYKHDDHTTAINLINSQWERINLQHIFAREQDQFEMIRILHAECVVPQLRQAMAKFWALNYCSIKGGKLQT